jgi:hypothetical protein
MTQIDRGLGQRPLRGSRPELERAPVAATPVAKVTVDRHVYRERAGVPRPGLVQRAASISLHPDRLEGSKPSKFSTLLHRDLPASPLEVDAGDGCSSLADGAAWCSSPVPFPFNSIGGTGTILLNGSVEALPSSRRAAVPAGSLQRLQRHAQALVLDRKAVAELGARQHLAVGQKIKDLLLETAMAQSLAAADKPFPLAVGHTPGAVRYC